MFEHGHHIFIGQDDRTHCVDNTDPRALTEERLRYVFVDATDEQIENFLDVFYAVKPGEEADLGLLV